jgi:hypothetical protein
VVVSDQVAIDTVWAQEREGRGKRRIEKTIVIISRFIMFNLHQTPLG